MLPDLSGLPESTVELRPRRVRATLSATCHMAQLRSEAATALLEEAPSFARLYQRIRVAGVSRDLQRRASVTCLALHILQDFLVALKLLFASQRLGCEACKSMSLSLLRPLQSSSGRISSENPPSSASESKHHIAKTNTETQQLQV